MRSIPLDDAVAFSACKFWQSLGYKRAAVIWENNAYGETYKEGLVRSCLTMGIQVESISVQTEVEGQPSSLPAQVTQMKQSNLKIFFVVVVDDNTLAALLKLAFESELLGSGTLWVSKSFSLVLCLKPQITVHVLGASNLHFVIAYLPAPPP